MMMFFKKIDEKLLKDAGPELSRVLNFKEKLISERKILFDQFEELGDWASKLRRSLADYLNKKILLENLGEERKSGTASAEPSDMVSIENSDHGVHFGIDALSNYVEKYKQLRNADVLTAAEIARIRLVAASIGWSANDTITLGPHDANLIFIHRDKFEFEVRELRNLTAGGIEAINRQNVPLWTWLKRLTKTDSHWLFLRTANSDNIIQQQAFKVMRLLGVSISEVADFERSEVVNVWLDNEKDDAKIQALKYLREFGITDDAARISKELESGSGAVVTAALEALATISWQDDAKQSAQIIVSTQFEQIDDEVLKKSLGFMRDLDISQVHLALEHRNSIVRELALKELLRRGQSTNEIGWRFITDNNARVRLAAITMIETLEGDIALPEAQKLLVQPRASKGLFGGIGAGSDRQGEKARDEHKNSRFQKLSNADLNALMEDYSIDTDLAYFTNVRRNFAKSENEFRSNIDDQFSEYFDRNLKIAESYFSITESGRSLVERIRKSKKASQRFLLKDAFDLVCDRSEKIDLGRMRHAIDEDQVDPDRKFLIYLGRHGSPDDIDRIAKMSQKYESTGESGLLGIGVPLSRYAADAALKIFSNDLSKLTTYELPQSMLAQVLEQGSNRAFEQLSDDEILNFFYNESTEIRQASVIKGIIALSKTRTRKLLRAYEKTDGQFYYNVLFWLDLANAYSQKTARSAANRFKNVN